MSDGLGAEGRLAGQVQQRLVALVAEHGADVLDDARRVRAMLADTVPSAKREINLIGLALAEGVPARLAAAAGDPLRLRTEVENLARQLERNNALTADAAQWAVAACVTALGLVAPHDDAGHSATVPAPSATTWPFPSPGGPTGATDAVTLTPDLPAPTPLPLPKPARQRPAAATAVAAVLVVLAATGGAFMLGRKNHPPIGDPSPTKVSSALTSPSATASPTPSGASPATTSPATTPASPTAASSSTTPSTSSSPPTPAATTSAPARTPTKRAAPTYNWPNPRDTPAQAQLRRYLHDNLPSSSDCVESQTDAGATASLDCDVTGRQTALSANARSYSRAGWSTGLALIAQQKPLLTSSSEGTFTQIVRGGAVHHGTWLGGVPGDTNGLMECYWADYDARIIIVGFPESATPTTSLAQDWVHSLLNRYPGGAANLTFKVTSRG